MKSTTAILSLMVAGIAFSSIAADKAPVKKTVIPARLHCARIDVSGTKDKIVLKPVKGMATAGWLKKRKLDQNYLYSHSKPLKGEIWEDMEVAFVPDKDGAVILSLRGMWYRPKGEKKNIQIWVAFDEIKITGAELKNGGFEQLGKKGNVAHWHLQGKLAEGQAQAGNNSIKVWANKAAFQTIKVKKGQQVTIKAKVKKTD